MNPEIYEIIKTMQQLAPPRYVEVSDYEKVQTHQMLNMARLMVLLAEEQEKASAKMEQLTVELAAQTSTLTKFTKRLYWLTVALLLLAFVQLVGAFAFHS